MSNQISKMTQAVRWLLADTSRKQIEAARMFGVNQGNLSKAIRDARNNKRDAGECCSMCGQLLPHARDRYAEYVDIPPPAAPGFVCVVPTTAPVTVPHMTPLMQELGVVTSEEAKEIARKLWVTDDK